jgi:hypothetical protein
MEDNMEYDAPNVAKLPNWWTPTFGLNYPLVLKTVDGTITLNSYEEHHALIRKLFLPVNLQ